MIDFVIGLMVILRIVLVLIETVHLSFYWSFVPFY